MPTVEDLPGGTTINDIQLAGEEPVQCRVRFSYGRFLGNMAVNYTDEAYWQDVLGRGFSGTTRPTRW